jgi:hypothetical protein
MAEKYCVLPGQVPVRLSSTQGGHTVIIGEIPREIPEIFVREALSKGCYTESQVNEIKGKLVSSQDAPPADPPLVPPADPSVQADPEKAAKILAATIEILNVGNPDDLTTTGKPKADVISDLCGFEVTGKERDEAFAQAKEG